MHNAENNNWRGTTFGTGWMHSSLTWMLKVIDVRFFYILSALFIIPAYMIFGSKFGIIYDFYRRRMKMGFLHSFIMVWRNFYRFSTVVIDKFAMAAGKQYDIFVDGYDILQKNYNQKDGVLQFSSHIGCFEIAGFSLKSSLKRISAVVFAGEKESVMETRRRLFEANNISMILVGDGIEHIFKIKEALENGNAVNIPSDRILGSQKVIRTEFLENMVSLPIGPFKLAVVNNCPVMAVNGFKTSSGSYKVYISELTFDRAEPREKQMQQLASAFAREMERLIILYPSQWFNYYDFWRQ